jgi:hypothetical protein
MAGFRGRHRPGTEMMLSYPQRLTTALCAAAVGLLIVFCALWGPRPLPPLSIPAAPARFEGAAAFEFTRIVAEEFPDRVTGTPAAHRAADYLRAQLRNSGYAVTLEPFSLWLHGKEVEGENVIAQWEGDSPESLAILAHYDSALTTHQAAADNASGVGVLLELARALRQGPHSHGLILAATDAEEWGMIGARELTGFFKRHHTVAVISVKAIMPGPPRSLKMNCMGQFGGYTPLRLRQLLVAAGRAQGVTVEQAVGRREWIERALEVSAQDQGPLLRAGIPAVDIGTLSTRAEASSRVHTPEDVFRDFDPAAFQMAGATVERAIDVLDTLPPGASGTLGPRPSSPLRAPEVMAWGRDSRDEDFQVSPARYIPGKLIHVIQILLLLPILLAAFFAASNLAADDCDLRGWRFFEPVCWIIPPGLATLLLYGLTALNILPRYELYPATTKDPFLYQLHLILLGMLAAVIVVGSVELQKLRVHVDAPPVPFAVRKRILFLWVTIVALVGFFNNPYAMWLFLGALAYATALLPPPRGLVRRAVNAALLIAAAAPFAALLGSFGREMYLGWRVIWYLVLQTAYGVWSPVAVALFLLALVLAAQLFWISVVNPQDGVRHPL